MSKLTVAQLADTVETLRTEIATLRAEIGVLRSELSARPSHTHTSALGRLAGTPEQRRAAAQRLAAKYPGRCFTLSEVIAEVEHG